MFISLFNLADAYKNGQLYAFSFKALDPDLSESIGSGFPHKTAKGSGELAYDTAPVGGRGGQEDDPFLDDEAYPTTEDDALVADLAPLTIDQNQISRDQIVYYTIEDGDTVSKIADEFGISPNTLLWANSLSGADYIKAGQRLEILPTDGIKYTVKQGDTLGLIAQKYKTGTDEIIAYNNLPADGRISAGDALILPGGRPYIPPAPPAPKKSSYAQKPPAISNANSNKYFIFPASGRISQGLHGYNGVDIASQCGAPIYAAADGTVTSAKTTTSRARLGASVYSGYGNHLRITHPNGVVTLYAHLRQLFVAEGSSVKQGDVIASMGGGFEYVNGKLVRMEGAGKSTGCHLHFEVRGAKNFVLSR